MKHTDRETALRSLGLTLSTRQVEQLAAFEALLAGRAIPMGMVARADADRLWERHILDSLRAAPVLHDVVTTIDVGSGAGLPGVPLAIALPHVEVTLLEMRRQRVAFLELAQAELGLSNLSIFLGRTADAKFRAQSATARAVASAERTWALAEPLLQVGGRLLYWAGEGKGATPVLPRGVKAQSLTSPVANMGPIVIMSRQ